MIIYSVTRYFISFFSFREGKLLSRKRIEIDGKKYRFKKSKQWEKFIFLLPYFACLGFIGFLIGKHFFRLQEINTGEVFLWSICFASGVVVYLSSVSKEKIWHKFFLLSLCMFFLVLLIVQISGMRVFFVVACFSTGYFFSGYLYWFLDDVYYIEDEKIIFKVSRDD